MFIQNLQNTNNAFKTDCERLEEENKNVKEKIEAMTLEYDLMEAKNKELKESYEELTEKYKVVLNEIEMIKKDGSKAINSTENSTMEKSDKIYFEYVEALKEEIKTLKVLNGEVMEKNELLKEKINKNPINTSKLYSEVLNDSSNKNIAVPVVRVRPKDKKAKSDIMESIYKQFTENIIIPLNNVRKTGNGDVLIKCSNIKDVQKTMDNLQEKIGEHYEINCTQIESPR